MKPETVRADGMFRVRDVLTMAAWFGLVAGLVEAAGLLLFQRLNWLNWDMALVGVWYEILWVSPVFNLLLFGAVGLTLGVLGRWLPERLLLRMSVFVFAFMMFLDWGLLTGRIRHSAALVLAAGLASVAARRVERDAAAAQRFWQRSLPWVAALALAALLGVEGGGWLWEKNSIAKLPPAAPGTPNVLVLLVDTLRADHLSTYGYTRNTSPNIDQLARQGVLFERAFAASSWTLPSHASLLTGRYPHEHGATDDSYDGRFPNIAETLRERGYRTASFSTNVFYFTRRNGFGRGFIRFDDYFHSPTDMAARTVFGRKFCRFVLRRLGYKDIPARRWAGQLNQALLRWLDRDTARPFFAFVNYFDVHSPYLPPQPYRSRFSKLPNPGGRINHYLQQKRPELTPEQLQGEVDAYDGAIAYTDDQIGRLLAELRKRRLEENTIVVITSDHGESFGEHGLLLHVQALYRPLIQVPLLVSWPGKLPAGVRVTTPVSQVALPATLMELIGTGGQGVFPGPSLAQLWKNPGANSEIPYPLSELSHMPFEALKHAPNYYGAMQSLVSPQWHYIHNDKLGAELFDWERDPQEIHNLAQTPEGQRIANEFAARLETMLGQKPKTAWKESSGNAR